MKRTTICALLLVTLMIAPLSAEDDGGKKKQRGRRGGQNAAAQLLKQLADIELTDEQVSKVKDLGKTATAKMKELREEAGITTELTRKRAEVQKSLRDSGKKGKELIAAINKQAGYTEAQAAALVKVNQVRQQFQKEVVALLTDQQKAKLPERMQRAAKQRKGKGKRKKDAA